MKPIIFILALLFITPLLGCQAKTEDVHQKELYQCSMHPQIVSDRPGKCPICHMPLTKVDAGHTPTEHAKANPSSQIYVSPERQQLIGLKTTEVKEMPLQVTIRTLGRVGYDPDLFDAILQYREALIAVRRQRGNPSTTIKQRRDEVKELAMQKLRLAGLSDMQIDRLTAYGQLSQWPELPPDTRWVYADIYEYESNLVKPGQKVHITSPIFPGKKIEGTVKTADEIYNASSFIQRIRIEMQDADLMLKHGQSVNVEIMANLGTGLAIPVDAVLDTGGQQRVFVDQGSGHLEAREVKLGYEANDFYEVLEGLKVGEKVVSAATFLIDSESRLQAAAQSYSSSTGHQHG